MNVTIDPNAGFCFGVEKAVEKAEQNVSNAEGMFCLGEIVHNGEEVSRLNKLGLQSINKSELESIQNSKLLIRAHGEPPETYKIAEQNQNNVIDATCPIVLKLQKRVQKAWEEMLEVGGQIAIIGNKNHPEVIGLNGQTGYKAIIIQDKEDIEQIDINKPLRLFAQTTIKTEKYNQIVSEIKSKIRSEFIHYNTICKHVSNREPNLIEFCKKKDVVLFVSGKNSSNGKSLFEVCQSTNSKSYLISSPGEIQNEWFNSANSIGISGATSTPAWLMKKVKDEVLSL